MIFEEFKKIKHGRAELKKFGITIVIVLGLLGGLLLWKAKWYYFYLFLFSAVFIISGYTIPFLLKPIYMGWMTLAVIMGWVMTRIILMFLFYLVVTPIALLARVTGYIFLETKFDKKCNSYWFPQNPTSSNKENYEKQF